MHTEADHVPAAGRDSQRLVMGISLVASVFMLAGKMGAWYITGSSAILSDAIESVIHGLATGFAAFSLWFAVRPPDENHPYGHGKITYFSAGFEGGLIMIAAAVILYTAIVALVRGPELQQLDIGLAITGVLMLFNLALGVSLVRVGKKHDNLVLVSNGQHVLTDMWTSLGVLVGVALVMWTGATWLDPVAAIFVALNILWTAGSLMRKSVLGLMEQVDPAVTEKIAAVLAAAVEAGEIRDFHELRHRRIGNRYWVEYHLLFADHLTVTEAHGRAHRVDGAVRAIFGHTPVVVTAHLEPEHAHDEAHPLGHEDPGGVSGGQVSG